MVRASCRSAQPAHSLYNIFTRFISLKATSAWNNVSVSYRRQLRFVHPSGVSFQTQCHSFADPYVEHDTLTLLLDLILLKRGVFRHLLFNRGSPPKRETDERSKLQSEMDGQGADQREQQRRETILKLGLTLILVDAFVRWSNRHPLNVNSSGEQEVWNQEAGRAFLQTLLNCFIETTSFHIGITFCCAVVVHTLNFFHSRRGTTTSAVRRELRLSHVPLTLLYSSLTKLFLLLMLSIWRPENFVKNSDSWSTYNNTFISGALELLDEDRLDRQWVVRNVLGGMAAGFGLRVVLDCHPLLTVLVILGGWFVKTAVTHVASSWIGEVEGQDDGWLAYSIP